MSAKTLGKRIKLEREKKRISLRKFAEMLGISAAYLVDIEKDRRLPTEELLQKTADLLDIPVATFDEFSPDVPKAVKDWLDKNPLLGKVMSLLRKGSPDETLAKFEKAIVRPRQRKFTIAIYHSELQAIGSESASWDTETGGDLFGIWGDVPVVYFASRAGPNAKREHAHFRLDVDYLIKLSGQLEKDWGLRYFGDWHSHHRLGLSTPSAGDQRRIVSVGAKNTFDEMAEFIITFASGQDAEKTIVINPYAYLDLPSQTLTDVALIVLEGTSPVRSALIAASSMPEQQLTAFSSFPIERISFSVEPVGRVSGTVGSSMFQISERLLHKAMSALTTVSSGELELYRESFGFVVVAPVNDKQNIAFAIDKNWPHSLLQVEWIDRKSGSTEEISADLAGLTLLTTERLKEIYSTAKGSMIGQKNDTP